LFAAVVKENTMPTETAQIPIRIIDVEEDANLLQVSWNQGFLEKVKDEHSLKHKEAVLFVNKAQDRFRLVACFYGLAVLVLPPVNPENRLSLYLKVSQFLRKFSIRGTVTETIDFEIETAKRRVARRAAAAKKASLEPKLRKARK
jgi:hypothetical protein